MSSRPTRSSNKRFVFSIIATGVFMSTMDSSMVNIALPTIMDEFHSPLKSTEWVVSIYLLTITATLVLWGSFSDRAGKGKVYARGTLVFALGSLFCSFSPSLPWLIGSRFIQAVGAAMIMATGPAIIRETFPVDQLGRSLGLVGVAVSLGLMTGPTLSGAIMEHFSWRAIFMVTVPIGALLSFLARMFISPTTHPRRRGRLDWPGAVLWTFGLVALCIALTIAATPVHSPWRLAPFLLLAVFFFLLFVAVEKKSHHPLLPLHLFEHSYFTIGVLCAALSFLMLFAVTLLTPFYLDRLQSLSPMLIGLVMMAIPVVVMFVAPLAGFLSDIMGPRLLTSLGLFLNCLGLVFLAFLDSTTSPVGTALRLAIMGTGQAMFLSPNSASILGRVEIEYAGASAAILATARNLGMLLGISLASLAFAVSFRILTNGLDMRDFSQQHTASFMLSLRYTYLAVGAIGMMGVVLSLFRGRG